MGIRSEPAVLLDLVPADFADGERIDRAAAEASLGVSSPSDHKALLDVYEVGDLGGFVILAPVPRPSCPGGPG
ncbi:hypothetical protein ACWCYY_19085 [Kitasatospora sp. NPDC001664]